jgi:hypothetical protein
MTTKKVQKAGNNANQIQAETVILGISEKRAREIFDEKLETALKSFTAEALDEAKRRNAVFDESLIKRIVEEKAEAAFGDPSFQLLLVEAQKSAAATEREADYDLLSELLIHRHKKGENRNTRAAIVRAVEIVDQVSDEALLGITAFHSACTFVPRGRDLASGLKILDGLFSKILVEELPEGNGWLDHLDILDALRTSTFGGTKKLEEFWLSYNKDLCLKGINSDSEQYSQAKEILVKAGLDDSLLVKSTIDENYYRIPVSRRSEIENLILNSNGKNRPPTTAEIQALDEIFELYSEETISESALAEEIDRYDNLKKLRSWWNSLTDQSIHITSVGRVLAHSNAQRINPNLLSLN